MCSFVHTRYIPDTVNIIQTYAALHKYKQDIAVASPEVEDLTDYAMLYADPLTMLYLIARKTSPLVSMELHPKALEEAVRTYYNTHFKAVPRIK
jgi:hypothetical protein